MASLEGKITVVTGAAGGMGGGITRRFVADGATVICLDIADQTARIAELDAIRNGAATAVQQDVRDGDGMDACIESVVARHGRIDVMVNNAGKEQPLQGIIESTKDVYDDVMGTNLWGVINGCRAAGRVMKEQRSGNVINTSSQLGKVAFETWGIYSASKAGVISVTQAMARELARDGVRVNAICPGTFDTPLAMRAFAAYAQRLGTTPQEIAESYPRDSIGLGRLGSPDDMGALCSFLASDDAAFMTGAALNLTGGEQYFF